MEKVIKFKGIGTHWHISIFDNNINDTELLSIQDKILKLVKEFENNYSRFDSNSLLSKLNKDKKLTNAAPEFMELINLGIYAKEITEGHFDISVGGVLEDMGYDSVYSFVRNPFSPEVTNLINIEGNNLSLGKNTRIDLGGNGKGYLIDKVSKIIKDSNVKYFFVNAGGDIYASSNFDKPIEFALENPFNFTEMIGSIQIVNKGIASSSNARRNWLDKKNNQKLGHLIDMRTKITVSFVSAVYTLSNSATNSDIASTCLFVSPKALYPKIAKYYQVEYMVVFEDGNYEKSPKYSAILNNK